MPCRTTSANACIVGFAANWRFALTGSDYLQADLAPGPLQHYWSLAVEEQFYLLWPVLLILTLAIATLLRRSARTFVAASLVLVVVVIAVSFVWSLCETQANPAVAYFSTLGRAWELGVGALLAIAAPYLRTILRRRVMAVAVVWIGLAGIAYSAVVINAESIFPEPEAALMMGAAAPIIVSGIDFRDRTTVLLCNPVTDFLGRISYSLYLWHWPVVVILGSRLEMGPVLNQAILLSVSVLLATASFYLVEDPVRKSGWLRDSARTSGSRTSFGCMVTGLVMTTLLCLLAFAPSNNPGGGTGTAQRSTGNSSSSAASSEGEPEGANALIEDPTLGAPTDEVPELTPSVNSIADDVPQGYGDNCHQDQEGTEAKACVVDHSGADSKEQVVALVGDSHANQWRPAIEDLVKSEGMRLEVYTKSACPMNTTTLVQPGASRPYSSCAGWNSNVLDKLASDPPSMVFVSSSIYVSGFDDGEFVEGQGGLDLVTEG